MILKGKEIAERIQTALQASVAACKKRPPCLAVILVGDNPASHAYVGQKVKTCQKIGIRSIRKDLPSTITQDELLTLIQGFNRDNSVDGILVQLPLPSHINALDVIQAIDPEKDVDGFHPVNMGKLLIGDRSGFVPCTPLGIQRLLKESQISTVGKEVVIVGRSNIVGKPLAALLMQPNEDANATVTIAHSKTAHLKEITLSADILIAATGNPRFIVADMVKKGAVVIDVGMNRINDKLVGDVDFDTVAPKCSFITPVPGGVGPMTITSLMQNTLTSYQKRCGNY